MRITTGMMSTKYLRNLNNSEESMNYAMEQVASGRKFFKGSEDPISAIKAYKLRREYRETEMYDSNISSADSVLTSAESNLTEINDNIKLVYTSTLSGITGTKTSEEREIIAKQLDNLQESMLTALNSKIEDKYIFGGTSRAEMPFTVYADEKKVNHLLYKGFDVSTGEKLPSETPKVYTDLDKLANETVSVDLGLGIEVGEDGNVKNSTVFDMSLSGIKFMGYGTDDEGISNNLYSLIGEIKDQLRSDDFSMDKVNPYLEKFTKEKSNLLIGITDIGAKTNYLDFLEVRNEDCKDNLTKRLKEVELVNTAEAASDLAMKKYLYNAALSVGTKILQNSFIDFMN